MSAKWASGGATLEDVKIAREEWFNFTVLVLCGGGIVWNLVLFLLYLDETAPWSPAAGALLSIPCPWPFTRPLWCCVPRWGLPPPSMPCGDMIL